MGLQSNRSVYLSEKSSQPLRTTRPLARSFIAFFSAALAILILVVGLPILNPATDEKTVAQVDAAGGIFCYEAIGAGMSNKANWGSWLSSPIYPDMKNRTFTLEEIAGNLTAWPHYYGFGEGETFTVDSQDIPTNPTESTLGNYGNFSEKKSKLGEPRNLMNCTIGFLVNQTAGYLLGGASFFSGLSGWIATMAFNSEIICAADATAATGAPCIDLLKIIGGRSSTDQGGIIGALTSSIYLPLILMAVLVVALWILYRGIVQRKIREALFGAIWLALSFVMGLALLLMPNLLVKAPMEASNIVTACVIGAFSGDNCFDGSATNSSNEIVAANDAICISDGNATAGQKTAMVINSLRCNIWKAFVLQPYAQGSFGLNLSDLDANSVKLEPILKKAGIDPKASVSEKANEPGGICIRLKTSGSANDYRDKAIQFSSGSGAKICNLAVYELYMKGMFSTTTTDPSKLPQVDPHWYNVVMTAVNDDAMWNQWTGNPTSGTVKLGTAVVAGIASVLGGWLIGLTSVAALMFYISSVILIAFAPLFFLVGVHPGRGKKIMTGWFEKVISNLMKYLASAIFLLIAILFYSAILGNSENLGMTLLFVLLITAALLIYRKEILKLLSAVNMGGETMSSDFADKTISRVNSLKDRSARMATGIAGGAIGGALAAKGGGLGAMRDSVGAGMSDGLKRELKRGTGVTGNVFRQMARGTMDNKQTLSKRASQASKDLVTAENEFNAITNDLNNEFATMEQDQGLQQELAGTIAIQNDLARKNGLVVQHAIKDASNVEKNGADAVSPLFGQFQQLVSKLENLQVRHAIAVTNGDTQGAANLSNEMNAIRGQQAAVRADFNNNFENEAFAKEAWAHDEAIFDASYDKLAGKYLKTENGETYSHSAHLANIDELNKVNNRLEDSVKTMYDLNTQQNEAYNRIQLEETSARVYREAHENWRPGMEISDGDMRRHEDTVDRLARNAINEGGTPQAQTMLDHKARVDALAGANTPVDAPALTSGNQSAQTKDTQRLSTRVDAPDELDSSYFDPSQRLYDSPRADKRQDVTDQGFIDYNEEAYQATAQPRAQKTQPTPPVEPSPIARETRTTAPTAPRTSDTADSSSTPASTDQSRGQNSRLPRQPRPEVPAPIEQKDERRNESRPAPVVNTSASNASQMQAAVNAAQTQANESNRAAAEQQINQIQAESRSLRNRMNDLVGGTNHSIGYERMLKEIEKVTAATDLTEDEVTARLERVRRENAELSRKTAGLGSSMAPGAKALEDEVERQIQNVSIFKRKTTSSDPLQGNAASAPTEGRSSRRRLPKSPKPNQD